MTWDIQVHHISHMAHTCVTHTHVRHTCVQHVTSGIYVWYICMKYMCATFDIWYTRLKYMYEIRACNMWQVLYECETYVWNMCVQHLTRDIPVQNVCMKYLCAIFDGRYTRVKYMYKVCVCNVWQVIYACEMNGWNMWAQHLTRDIPVRNVCAIFDVWYTSLLQNIVSFLGLFCKKTYHFKEPTNRSTSRVIQCTHMCKMHTHWKTHIYDVYVIHMHITAHVMYAHAHFIQTFRTYVL